MKQELELYVVMGVLTLVFLDIVVYNDGAVLVRVFNVIVEIIERVG